MNLQTVAQEQADKVDRCVLEFALAGVRQAKARYIARDLAPWVPEQLVYASLLRRGVFKWLAVRRHLIKLKDRWKAEIRTLHAQLSQERNPVRRAALKARLQALTEARQAVRRLCHLPRATAPDNDTEARRFVERQAEIAGPLIGTKVRVWTEDDPNSGNLARDGEIGIVLEYDQWGTMNRRVRLAFFDIDGRPYIGPWLRPTRMEVVRP